MSKSSLSRDAVLEALRRIVTPGAKMLALADDLGLRKQAYAHLKHLLDELVAEGVVEMKPGGAFALLPTGRISDNKSKRGRRASVVREFIAPTAKAVKAGPAAAATGKIPWATADDYDDAAPAPLAPGPAAAHRPATKLANVSSRKAASGPRGSGRVTDRPLGQASSSSPRAGLGKPVATTRPSQPVEAYEPPAFTPEPQSAGKAGAGGTTAGPVSAAASSSANAPTVASAASGAVAATSPRSDLPVGRITVNPAGYGFVVTDDKQTVFVPAKYRANSLDGDRVTLTTWQGVKGTEGAVAEVVTRGRARLTGILRRAARAIYVEPDDPRLAADYGRVLVEGATQGHDGDCVVLQISRYPTAISKELAGRVLKVLGDPDDPRTEIEKILAVSCVPMEFPHDAIAQAQNTAQTLGPADFIDRVDLRDKRFCTIDPETARDFDDALCIEDGPTGGTRVWVAVADVSHYVRWNDALDREASVRGVSVYLPDRVINMLPRELSAGICSLNPDVERCAMVVRLDYDDQANLIDVSYAGAVIRSHARLDYPGVASALGGDFRGRVAMYRPFLGELQRLAALAQKLRAKRRARGALELELPEPKVVLDADDARLVRDVVRSKGDPAVKGAYELVEEYMIAANEAVGSFFRKRGLTTVWRVHAPPREDRIGQLAELLASYGVDVDVEAAGTPLGMKAVLDQIVDMPSAQALSFLVLRTLTQAVWDTVPVGHFGLASGDYLHFTSPIRRYPDLLVHRLLKHYLHKEGRPSGGGYAAAPPNAEELAALASASSGFERRAIEAERDAVAMYRAYLMRDRVGEQFPGTVTAVTSFGVFVEIETPFVEGLIKLDDLRADQFDFDEVHMRLSGRRTGLTIQLGDAVIVEVLNVSVSRRRIELALLSGGAVRKRDEAAVSGTVSARRRAGKAIDKAQRHHRDFQPGGRPNAIRGERRGPRPGADGNRPSPQRPDADRPSSHRQGASASSEIGRQARRDDERRNPAGRKRGKVKPIGKGKLRLKVSHGADQGKKGKAPKLKVRR